jgi:hypothetical protein
MKEKNVYNTETRKSMKVSSGPNVIKLFTAVI